MVISDDNIRHEAIAMHTAEIASPIVLDMNSNKTLSLLFSFLLYFTLILYFFNYLTV